jgi:hypothetical protein
MKFSPLPCYLVHLSLKYSPQHPILKHSHPALLPQCERPSFTPIQKSGNFIFLYILIVKFLDSKLEDKTFCTEWQQELRDFNNNHHHLLQMGCHPVAVIILHVFPNTANKFT